MPDYDLFHFFRITAGWVATVYATILTVYSLWGWYVWLAGSDRYMSMLRRYVILQGVRLKFRTFWGDCLICALLCVAFMLIWYAHFPVWGIEKALKPTPKYTHVATASH